MSRIPMVSGFTIIPEGTHVFRIYDVKYEENFGKIEVHLVNADGLTHVERFTIMGNRRGEYNEGALKAFSYFAKTAMNDYSLDDIDPIELINHFIEAEVIHTKQQNRNDPSKTVTFANLGDKSPANYFTSEPRSEKALQLGTPYVVFKEINIDELLSD